MKLLRRIKNLKKRFDNWFYDDRVELEMPMGRVSTNRYTLLIIILIAYVLVSFILLSLGLYK